MNKFFHKYTTLNSLFYYICIRNRDVAQLVARHVRDVEAAGSSPVISTEITVLHYVLMHYGCFNF